MATLKTIRKRITSVKNTQKITKAMKMVAAAKLRRAQQAVESSRPFADRLHRIILSIVDTQAGSVHPLCQPKEKPKKISMLLFTSNRGLCGGFNSSLLRRVDTFLKGAKAQYEIIDLSVIGRKGRDYYKARRRELKDIFVDYAANFPMAEAEGKAREMIEGYQKGEYDEYYIVFNRFKSALSQEVQIQKLIPFSVGETESKKTETEKGISSIRKIPSSKESESLKPEGGVVDFLYEPSRQEVLDWVIPKYVATQLYRAHLESVASELGSRMTAMESATNNASDMIDSLTLQYNRLRQAAITKELMDIVNGAEAIK